MCNYTGRMYLYWYHITIQDMFQENWLTFLDLHKKILLYSFAPSFASFSKHKIFFSLPLLIFVITLEIYKNLSSKPILVPRYFLSFTKVQRASQYHSQSRCGRFLQNFQNNDTITSCLRLGLELYFLLLFNKYIGVLTNSKPFHYALAPFTKL